MEDWELEQVKMAARDSWEEEDVADSWDAEEEEVEEREQQQQQEVKVVKPKEVKANKKSTTASSASNTIETEESEQARKERMNRLIQESDLENAIALFGISKSEINVEEVLEITKKEVKKPVGAAGKESSTGYFETVQPQNWTEFETLSGTIVKKLKTLESSKHYPNFLEGLFRSLLQDRDVPEIRKISNMAGELVQTKQKDKLAQINKKKTPPSLAGVSKKSGRADMMDFGDDNDDDDYDGF